MHLSTQPQHTCPATLVLTNMRQYIDIIERDMQSGTIDTARLQRFAAQLQHDAALLADHARMMNEE